MIDTKLLSITLFIVGVISGALFGFWATLALLLSLMVLIAAKKAWKEKPSEPEPNPV